MPLKISSSTFFFLFSTTVLTVSVSAATSLPASRFHIQQEKIRHKDGVLIVRPKSIDFKIINLIQAHHIRSLEDYAGWLKQNIHYTTDETQDHWATPEETLNIKKGDCEDYTFLNAEVLQVLGYQPRFLAVRKNHRAHAICAFQADGYYFWFDNAELRKTHTTTLKDFLKHIRERHNYHAVSELDLKTSKWSVLAQPSLL